MPCQHVIIAEGRDVVCADTWTCFSLLIFAGWRDLHRNVHAPQADRKQSLRPIAGDPWMRPPCHQLRHRSDDSDHSLFYSDRSYMLLVAAGGCSWCLLGVGVIVDSHRHRRKLRLGVQWRAARTVGQMKEDDG